MTEKQYLKALGGIVRKFAKLQKQAIHKQESGAYMLALQHEENDRKEDLYTYYGKNKK